jgi:hypothetical protein
LTARAAREQDACMRSVAAGVFALAGLAAGVFAGIDYYNGHRGDWRIGVTALGIGAGIFLIGLLLAAAIWHFEPPADSVEENPRERASAGPSLEAPRSGLRSSSSWLDGLAALGAIGAGIYLLSSQTEANNSYLEVIAHGMGAYFVAKGIWMGRTAHLVSALLDYARHRDAGE